MSVTFVAKLSQKKMDSKDIKLMFMKIKNIIANYVIKFMLVQEV